MNGSPTKKVPKSAKENSPVKENSPSKSKANGSTNKSPLKVYKDKKENSSPSKSGLKAFCAEQVK